MAHSSQRQQPPPRHVAPNIALTARTKQHEPAFVQFGPSPAEQQKTLEDFLDESARQKCRVRRRYEEWKKKHPPQPRTPAPVHDDPAHAKRTPPPQPKPPAVLDDAAIANMSERKHYDLAREKTWELTKGQLKHMWENPGET